MAKNLNSAPPEVIRSLRPQAKIDLVVTMDLMRDKIDVRSGIVYEVEDNRVILSQTDPPVLKSFSGNPVHATFLVTRPGSPPRRWGYDTTILDVVADYRLRRDDPITQPAVFIGAPRGEFIESNVRLDYRIRVAPRDGLMVKIRGTTGRVTIIDLSVGGLLIAFPGAPRVAEGERLWYTLTFPDLTSLGGEAEIRRVSPQGKPVKSTLVGIKFLRLDVNAVRMLQKAVNRLMLQAQRAKYESEVEIASNT